MDDGVPAQEEDLELLIGALGVDPRLPPVAFADDGVHDAAQQAGPVPCIEEQHGADVANARADAAELDDDQGVQDLLKRAHELVRALWHLQDVGLDK